MARYTEVKIPLPYNLSWEEIQLEDLSKRQSDGSMDTEMDWLNDHISWVDEELMELIFRGTVILKRKFPEAPLGQCLHTSLVWAVG